MPAVEIQNFVPPEKVLNLDKTTSSFRGHERFCSDNLNKPRKWGMELHQVCDAATEYCYCFKIGTGKSREVYNLVHT